MADLEKDPGADEPITEAPPFKPTPWATKPDDLNDLDEKAAYPAYIGPDSADAQLLAHRAMAQPQAQAAQTLSLARSSGVPSPIVAADPQAAQVKAQRAQVAAQAASSPALAGYMKQSPAHAAVVRDEAQNLGSVTRWLGGLHSPEAKLDPETDLQYTPSGDLAGWETPPVVVSALEKAVRGIQLSMKGFEKFVLQSDVLNSETSGPDIEGVQKEIDELTTKQQSQTTLEKGAAQLPQQIVTGAAQLVPYALTGELTLPAMFMQTVGDLSAKGVSPGRAATGGAVASLFGAAAGTILQKSLAPIAEIKGVQKFVGDFASKLLTSPEAAKAAATVGWHAITGWAATAGMSFTQRVTEILDRASKTGKTVDSSEYWAAAKESMTDALKFLPVIGVTSTLGLIGQHLEAHANGMQHDVLTAPLKDSKVPPAELKDLAQRAVPKPQPDYSDPTYVKAKSDYDAALKAYNEGGSARALQHAANALHDIRDAALTDPSSVDPEALSAARGRYAELASKAGVPTEEAGIPQGLRNEPSLDKWREILTELEKKPPTPDNQALAFKAREAIATEHAGMVGAEHEQTIVQHKLIPRAPVHGPPAEPQPPLKYGRGSPYANRSVVGSQLPRVVAEGPERIPAPLKEPVVTTTDPNAEIQDTRITHAYIDPEHFEKVMREAGEDPEVASAVAEGSGFGWRHSKLTGEKLKVPIADYLSTLGPFHEALRDGVAFNDPNGATLSQNDGQWLTEESARAQNEATPPGKEPEPLWALRARAELEPTAKGLKTYSEAAVQEQTINELERAKGKHPKLATQAQKQADKLSSKTIDLLASAEQSAQQGIEAAVQSTETAQGGIVAGEAARKAPEILRKAIRKIVSEGRMAGIDPGAISDEVNKVVQSAITKEAGKAYQANVTPAQIQSIVKAEVAEARKAFTAAGRGSTKAQDLGTQATEKTITAGDNAQAIKELQKKRDLNLAMEAARAKAVERSDSLTKRLITAASDGARDSLYKGRGSFGGAHDLLMEALNLRTPDGSARPPDFESAAQDILSKGNVLDFEVGPIQDLVQNPRPIGDLKPAELENVVRASDNLRHLAGEARKTYVDGKLEDRARTISGDIQPSVAAGAAPPPSSRLGRAWESFREKTGAPARDAQSMNFHTLLQRLGDWGLSQAKRFIEVRRSRDVLLGRVSKVYETGPELISRGDESIPHPDWMPDQAKKIYGDALKRRDVWRVAQTSGTREGMNALASSWDVDPAQIHSWLNDVMNTKEEWDHVAERWRLADEFGDMERAADSNRGGVPMVMKTPRKIQTAFGEYEGGYAPVRWHDKGNALPAQEELGDTSRGINATRDTEHGFTKVQQEGVKGVIDISADNLPSHYRALVNDISLGDFVRDQSRMLNDPSFKDAVSPLGPDYYKALTSWHNTVAIGQVQNVVNSWYREPSIARAHGIASRIVFNLNLRVMAGLGGHLPFAKAVEGSGIDIASGIGSALSPEKWRYAMENSKVVPFRNERWFQKYNELQDAISHTGSSWEKALSAPSVALWHGADIALTQTIWHGLHDAALTRGLSPEAAIEHADLHTDRLMPAIDIYGKSLRATDPLIGMMMMAKNFESTVWNMKAQREWDTRAGTLPQGTGGLGKNQMIWKLGVAGALGLANFALLGHGRNPEEQKNGAAGWAQFAGRSLFEGGLYGNMLTHMVANQIGGTLMGEGWPKVDDVRIFDTPMHQQVQQFVRDIGKVTRFAQGKGRVTPALKAGLDASGRLFGVPPTSLVRPLDGAYKVARYQLLGSEGNDFRGRTPVTSVGSLGKVVYGDNDKWESNILSEFDNAWREYRGP